MKSLLCASSWIGLSTAELQAFQSEYRRTAFICTVRSCERSRFGYPSAVELEDHKIRQHTAGFKCYYQNCAYNDIGFTSSRSLRAHEKRAHLKDLPTIPQALKRKYQADDPSDAEVATEDLEAPTQPNANEMPSSQPIELPPSGPFPITTLTPELLAEMTPDQRQKYELMRNQQQAPEMIRFRTIAQEESKGFEAQRFPEVPMTAETRDQLGAFTSKISQEFIKFTKAINHWFRVSRDEPRLRAFVRTRLRILSQFQGSDSLQTLKENLTMTRQELMQAKQLIDSMMKDLASIQKGNRPPQPRVSAKD